MSEADRLLWLEAAREMLLRACGLELGDVRVIVAYSISGRGVEFRLRPLEDLAFVPAEGVQVAGTGNGNGQAQVRVEPVGLNPTERAILAAATRQPRTAKRLAGEMGRPCNSHFRGALRGLCRRDPPPLIHTPDGYRLPG